MTRFLQQACALSAVLMIAACATTAPTPYHARGDSNTGYYEEMRAANKYFVLYTETRNKNLDTYVRLRAAEIALAHGFPNFVLANEGVRRSNRTTTEFKTWAQIGTSQQITSNLNSVIPSANDQTNYSVYDAYGEVELLTADQARTRAGALDAKTVVAKGGVL